MAATNFTPIQLYHSTTASAVPLAANLAQGELAINITDGKLYYEDNTGAVQVIATKGAGTIGGSTTQIQYNNAGALAGNAAMVFNSATSTTTLTTLNLTNALGATFGGTAQSTYTQGDILYSSASNTLAKLGIGVVNYILTSSGSVPQWSAPTSIVVQTATNLAGGLAGSVPYQSALDTTTFLAIGAANRVMTSTGSAPQWVTSLTGLTGVSSSSITNTSLTSGRIVISSTAGLEADSANLTFNGTTLSTTGLSNSGFSTLVKTLTLGDTSFNGTAVFAPATPAKLYLGTGTVTDVTSAISATNTTGAIASLAITPIAATNTGVTYTNASTLYIAGAPSAGTNITITNPYSLYVDAGASYFGGLVTATGFAGPLNGTVGATTPTTGAFTTLTTSSTVTISGGTANGVAYLDGSKVLTTGSALTFDGTNFAATGKVNVGSPSATVARLNVQSSDTSLADFVNSGGTTGVFLSTDGTIPVIGSRGGDQGLRLQAAGSTSAAVLMFNAGASEGMRLTSTGLGIGNSSPQALLHVGSVVEAPGFGTTSQMCYVNGTSQPEVLVRETTNNVVVSMFADSTSGAIRTATNHPLIFYTNNTERARIGSNGYSKFSNVGSYIDTAGNYHEFRGDTQNGYVVITASTNATPLSEYVQEFRFSAATPNDGNARFWSCIDATAQRAYILSNGGLSNYSANDTNLSDRREKTNFAPATSYLDKICAIPVQTFNYIDQNHEEDGGLTLGVVAQDVQAVAPELVIESNWGSKEEPKMRLSIYQTDLQYALMKCIQEQQALITQLTARVAQLESKP